MVTWTGAVAVAVRSPGRGIGHQGATAPTHRRAPARLWAVQTR